MLGLILHPNKPRKSVGARLKYAAITTIITVSVAHYKKKIIR